MRKWISVLLPLVGLAIFVWIVSGAGIGRIWQTFQQVDPRRLLIFPLFTLFIVWIRGLRWWLLLRVAEIDYSRWRSSVVWAIGFFAAAVTPGKVGDAVRAFYIHRETGRGAGGAFLTVFVDRFLDLVTVLVFGVVTVVIFSYRYTDIGSIWVIVGTSLVLLAFLYLVLHRKLMRKLLGPVFRALTPGRYRAQLSAGVREFYDVLGLYGRRRRATAAAVGLTLTFWAGVVLLAYVVAWVLEIDVSFGYVALMMPVVTLMEIIPISISGIGTREAAVVFFFSAVNIGNAQAVAFSILYLFAGTYLTALVGFVAWLANPAKLRQ
jgi:uncharacterized protein (TIRG00374 family)